MRHPVLLLCLALAAACGERAPIPAGDLALRVTAGATDVELGRAFPLTVVRVWSRDLTPAVWRDDQLAPLALKLVEVSRREDDARVEETRRFAAYAFQPGDVTVPAPSFRARPRGGGPERVVSVEPLAFTVQPVLDPDDPGPVELPDGPVRPPLPWLPWTAGLAAALLALVLFFRSRRTRSVPAAPAPVEPPPPGPHERALERLAALRAPARRRGAVLRRGRGHRPGIRGRAVRAARGGDDERGAGHGGAGAAARDLPAHLRPREIRGRPSRSRGAGKRARPGRGLRAGDGAVTWLHPWLLLLALLVPAALWWRWRRGAPAVPFAPGPLARGLPRTWRVRLLPVPRVLETVGLLLVVAALARPVRRVAVPHVTEGLDLVLCLDTSSSMAATDMDPERTRLDLAKAAAARFIAERPHDRIGLVCFARYPDLRCPPTLDHDALRRILEGVAIVDSDGPEDATGIGTAVARAAQVLGGGGTKSKVVILLTDGEENIATRRRTDEIAPLHAGQLCRELGVRAYAIAAGLGTRDPKGEWVAIDTTQVERLAQRTGGRFFAARDADAIASVYAEIDELEKIEFAEPRYRLEERFPPLLAAALALLLAGRLLQATVLEVSP